MKCPKCHSENREGIKFCEECGAKEDVMFLEGRCLSYSRGVAYHLFIDVLNANFDISEGDGDSDVISSLYIPATKKRVLILS